MRIIFYLLAINLAGCAPVSLHNHAGLSDDMISPVFYPVVLFREYISNADGDRCSMYPTCSTYSLEAIKTQGAVKGWIMTCDRLMRCGRDELNISPTIEIKGEYRCYDPVRNNLR